MKDANDFIQKLDALPSLAQNVVLCTIYTIYVVCPYPNIIDEGGLIAMRKALDAREDKAISTDSFFPLAECVLKNNIFEYKNSFYKQLRGTAIVSKKSPP